jgi:hypothetical protein
VQRNAPPESPALPFAAALHFGAHQYGTEFAFNGASLGAKGNFQLKSHQNNSI